MLQTPTIVVSTRNWSGADPDFAPFIWHIRLAPSEFLCLLANQNVTFVTLFCTKLPFFCTVLPKNCISLSQSQWRNFFMYIINMGIQEGVFQNKVTPSLISIYKVCKMGCCLQTLFSIWSPVNRGGHFIGGYLLEVLHSYEINACF